jgi:hypothetical protein
MSDEKKVSRLNDVVDVLMLHYCGQENLTVSAKIFHVRIF